MHGRYSRPVKLILTVDGKALKLVDGFLDKALLSAVRKAGGDALRALRAESKRQTRNRTRIRAGYLANTSLPLKFAKGKDLGDLAWTMGVSGKAVPLGEYPRRQTKRGVQVEIVKGQRRLIEHAFLANTRSGRQSVFLRPTKARYPMGHRLGMSVADTFKDGKIPQAAIDRAQLVFSSAFTRLYALELKKG